MEFSKSSITKCEVIEEIGKKFIFLYCSISCVQIVQLIPKKYLRTLMSRLM